MSKRATNKQGAQYWKDRGGDTSRPVLMSHEDRQRLIRAPIIFRVVEPKTHAGTLIPRDLPTDGRRRPSTHLGNDESYGGAFTATNLEDLIALSEE